MDRSYPEIWKAIRDAPSAELRKPGGGTYKFSAYSFGEAGFVEISPELSTEIGEGIAASIAENFPTFDVLVPIYPAGHQWSGIVAMELWKLTNKRLPKTTSTLWERSLELPDELEIEVGSGYETRRLYNNYLKPGMKALVFDDVISTGGTHDAVLTAFKKKGIVPVGVQAILSKNEHKRKKLEDKHDVPVRALVHL